MIFLWLKRFAFTSQHIFQLESIMSLISLTLGSACLAVTMTVVSSYETTLEKTLIDRTGHLIVMQKESVHSQQMFDNKIKSLLSQPYHSTPFVSVSALAVHQGDTRGVLLEGMDLKSVHKVLNVKKQLIQGSFIQKPYEALIGKNLAEQLHLKIGSSFYISYSKSLDPQEWTPQLKKFNVKGIVDLGRSDFNSRYILTSLKSVQKLMGWGNQVMGVRLRFLSQDLLHTQQQALQQELGSQFWLKDWKSIHQNLFSAIEMEKILIFFILLVLIFAAGFNVSNQLFLDVLKRFRHIGILKAMGAGPGLIVQIFLIQGVTISVIGVFLGFLLGIGICFGLFEVYDVWSQLAPSQVYKLNTLILDFRFKDFFSIFVFSLLICMLSTLVPIRKALSLTPKEGLSVE